jgi:hypothetical protein
LQRKFVVMLHKNKGKMTKEELAYELEGVDYGEETTPEIEKKANESGLVIVFGYSDDNCEFRGAIYDEVGCGDINFTKNGVFVEEDDLEVFEKYGASLPFNTIKAVWSPEDEPEYSWIYKTDIPHATFNVYEDGEKFCRGIVFSINDLK